MEPDRESKKLNDDLVVFMRKRSETDAPRYTARLKTYVDIQEKRRRAAAARRRSEHVNRKDEAKDKAADNSDRQGGDEVHVNRKRGVSADKRQRSISGSRSREPVDRCCRRRRRRSRRRRRRSCRRRRRRCSRRRRRRSRRRRRRSCSRRRRRRSCRRRRRRR